jgi:PAS domain S-box-containing protein
MAEEMNRILLADDTADHASFVMQTVNARFPSVAVDTALSKARFLELLGGKSYSLMLVKCTLGWERAGDILKYCIKSGHDLPVIIIGDCEHEEGAIELMREGAEDYVLKTEQFAVTLPVVMEKVFQKHLEITEKKRLELQLKNSEKMYRSLIESMHDGVCMVNRDFQIVLANKYMLNQLKGETDEIVGKRCFEVLQKSSKPCDGKEHPCPTREVIRTGKPASVTHYRLSQSGDRVPEEMNAYPIFNEKGEITHIVEVVRDITERKKMEEKILHQEKLSVLIEMAGATAHELNQPLTVILPTVEHALTKIASGHRLTKDLTLLQKQCLRMADLVRKISEITTYQTKPYVGALKIIDIDKSSQPATIQDVSSPQQVLTSLLDALHRYSLIITDAGGTITFFNQYSEHLLGYKAEDLVHKKNVLFFSKKEHTAKTMADSRAPALKKGYWERKKTVITREGAEIDIDLCFAPLKDAQSQVTGFVGIAQHAAP